MSVNNKNEMTIRLNGSKSDNGLVRLSEFIEFIQSIKASLRGLDVSVSGKGRPSVYYRITGLKPSSASVTIEEVPIEKRPSTGNGIIPILVDAMDEIQSKGTLPSLLDIHILEAFKGLTKHLNKNITGIEITANGKQLEITNQLNAGIDKILGTNITTRGSVSGYLEAINVHSGNKFFIYPIVGAKKVECVFEHSLIERIKEGIERYINVVGVLYCRSKEPYPHKIKVEDIEIYPSEDDLPKLMDLKGIAPNLTGGIDSVNYIRKIRDEEE